MISPDALATELDTVARAVPGVVSLYSTAPAIVSAVRQIAAGPGGGTLVTVDLVEGSWQVVASIGVSSAAQAPHTAAAVSAALLAAIPAGVEATVAVRISRILD